MRGCLTLIIGFALGIALMFHWWPHVPAGTATTQASDMRVTLSDAYLARKVEQKAAANGVVKLQHVVITSAPPGDVVMRGDIGVGPLAAPIAVELQPVVQSGDVQVRIVSTQLAGIPIPGELTGIVADTINSSLRRLLGPGVQATGVTAQSGLLVISANNPAP